MITSIILINAERTKVSQVAEELVKIDGISEVYSVSGSYDLVAIIRVPHNEDLANLVTNKLVKVESIVKTETMLAFRAFTRNELEGVFSLGMD